MLKRRRGWILTLLVLLGLFVCGLGQLFRLRFAGGDVYPAYSSFRGDPLGCRVYFESLDQVSGLRVRRHVQSVAQLPDGPGTTLFVFGLPWREMSADEAEYQKLEAFLLGGGRLVVTLYPELTRPRLFTAGTGTNLPVFKNPLQEDDQRHPPINLREKWNFGFDYLPNVAGEKLFSSLQVRRVTEAPLPEHLPWHSALVFTNLADSWRVLYARGSNAVLVESRHGAGSIVLATDSYFVSNEALKQERAPDLLSWLAGRSREIVFNETHLGVQEQPGVATLARRYRLHGGVAALLLLAGLFLWKNAVSFVPGNQEVALSKPVVGRESAAGFENLLRRSVPERQLLQTSLDEWHRTAALDGRGTASRRARIRQLVEQFNQAEKPNLVATYRDMARILNRKL